MKNLFERLKPELLEEVEKRKEYIPHGMERFSRNLSELDYVIDLRYEDVLTLEEMYRKVYKENPINCWACFEKNEDQLA